MVLTVNGETIEVSAPNLKALLAELDHETGHVAIALNHQVVRRARWAETPLSDGDAVEIISPRQGG